MKGFFDKQLNFKLFILFCTAGMFIFSGCSAILTSVSSDMMTHLSGSIMNNDDLETVKDGAPAYLLMIDGLIRKDPDNKKMLTTAALLYSAYSDVFVKDKNRSRKLSAKALGYAKKAVCLENKNACGLQKMNFQDFETLLGTLDTGMIDPLFALGNAWAGWIMANKNDMNAVADLSKIESIMLRIIAMDETYKDGAPYLYLGSLATFLPPALGGRPEEGKTFFDRAIDLSGEKNLTAKVLYAKFYARIIFDRKLHDRLLNEVILADPVVQDHTLVNIWAQQQAKDLLLTADDYF